jgi:hypothetical protein
MPLSLSISLPISVCGCLPSPTAVTPSATPPPHLDALLARVQVLRLARLHARDQIGMVAALAQLHLNVYEVFGPQVGGAAREEGTVALEDLQGLGGGRTVV